MNKLSKLTALLLAIVLALGVPLGAAAESAEIETKTEYYEVADALLQLKIMAYTTYGEYWDFAKLIEESDFRTFFFGLPVDEQNAMAAYVESMFWDSLIAFTNVAPLPELEEVQPASAFSLLARDNEVATAAEVDNGLYTDKQVTGPDDNGYYTITLENYATGTVTTTTTTTTKPVDIVLVLDFSNSMSQSFDSNSDTSGSSEYVEVEGELDQSQTYYIQRSNGGYREVAWCTECEAWTYNCSDSDRWRHQSGTSYDPETTTFYTIKKDETEDSGDTTIPSDATKIEALQIAVNNFIQNVNDQYTETANHRISLIEYNTDANVRNGWTYVSDANLDDLKITDTELSSWQGQGTNTDLGLSSAKTQLDALGTDTTRQKVVVLFTDGVPGTSGQDSFTESVAVNAVSNALSIKNSGAVVYSVAVLTGADPTATISTTATTNATKINAMLHAISSNYPTASASYSGDTYYTTLNTINPLADVNGNGVIDGQTIDGKTDKSYYLTADSPASLNNIFQQISSSIQSGSSSVTLDETTIVRDEVTSYFEIPFVYVYEKDENGDYVLDADGNKIPVYETDANGNYVLDANGNKIQKRDYTAAQITIQEAACTGKDDDGNLTFGTATDANYSYEIDGNVLDVTGFDFSGNACMVVNNQPQGKKLIVSFKIKTVDGFLGGNDVVTNTSNSGVVEVKKDETTGETKEEMFESYPIPDVDVELWEITVVGKHQHIFLSNEADVNELLQSFSLTYTKEGGTESYTVNGIRNDYATLKFTLTTRENYQMIYTIEPGATVGTWTYVNANNGDPIENFDVTPFLTDDTTYTISYDVIPIEKADGSTGVAATSGSLAVGVHVYKPTFTFQDTTEDYLATVTADGYYETNNFVSESWSHTYYEEITVTINVSYDTNGTPSYSYVATDKNGAKIAEDADWNMATETIDFSGYGITEGIDYEVKMSGEKPTVTFSYDPDETEWITDGKVTAVECVDVNVTAVTLTSNNTHEKVTLGEGGAVTEDEYTTTSVYTEGSDTASAKITVDASGAQSTPAVTGTHITTKRIEDACSFCKTTDNTVDSTDIHSTSTLEFVVHIKNAFSELQIVKEGLSVGESAIFKVTGYVPNGTANGEQKIWTVVLTKTSADAEPSVTITGLLVDSTATVVEDGNWSWRYKTTTYDPTSASVSIVPKTDSNYPSTVTVTNSGKTNQWLDDEVAVQNDFSKNGQGTVID